MRNLNVLPTDVSSFFFNVRRHFPHYFDLKDFQFDLLTFTEEYLVLLLFV